MSRTRVAIVVTGRVQGVGFRMHAQTRARELRLTGWVRNLPGGREVAMEVEGPARQVEAFVAWAASGPGAAKVSGLSTTPQTPTGDERDFQIWR